MSMTIQANLAATSRQVNFRRVTDLFDEPPPSLPTLNAWDRRLDDIGGHISQSWRWGEFKQRHGWTARRIHVSDSAGTAMAQVLYRFQGPLRVGYIPHGPAISGDPDVLWPLLLEHIDAHARSNRTIMTLIEPNEPVALVGTPPVGDADRQRDRFQPGQTVRIPLADDETMLRRMHRKTRHHVHLAQRRGVKVERHPAGQLAVGALHRLIEEAARRNGSEIHSPAYYEDFLHTFGDDAVLLVARADDGGLAAALIAARFGKDAAWMYGGSSAADGADGASFLLQFEAMRWARDQGCATYDLQGLPDQDPERPGNDDGHRLEWLKTGFGGEIVTFPAMLERQHVPVPSWLARTLKRIER